MDTLEKEILQNIDDINNSIIKIRQNLHANPELSGEEKHTRDLVKNHLLDCGYTIKQFKNHYGLVVEYIKDPNLKTVAIRADMDALPICEKTDISYKSSKQNIMHACGHDSHTAIVLGVALALSKIKDKLNGNIRFIFQASEETIEGGSVDLIDDGALDGVDMIFGLHAYPYLNTGQIGYKYGVMMASADIFSIEIFGKSSHGARPHEGVDAILVTSMIVNSLNHIVSRRIDPLHPAVISLGTIEGGTVQNIICNHVLLKGTVRTINEDVREDIPKLMEESIKGVCESMGASYKFDYIFGQPELINDNRSTDIILNSAKKIIDEADCIDLIDPVMGGEDFSKYLKEADGAFFRLGTCNEAKGTCIPQHNSKFNVDDDALQIGMKILALSIIEALE